ncbi:MAG: hypothetical protein Ct9H300mP11_12770 [Chloroflexota bacterium]|nr:MAG: hypothetical protein Ct9H300mP11_12770 [Chloroflexota bacterium]
MVKCIDLIPSFWQPPTGYVAPWWEFSHKTNELLLKHGIKYDHSLMHRDFECYYVRRVTVGLKSIIPNLLNIGCMR